MKESRFVLGGEESTQMKAIALLIQKASAFRSNIHIQSGEKRANAKSLLGLMTLGLAPGSEIILIAEGDDEDEALEILQEWLLHPELD